MIEETILRVADVSSFLEVHGPLDVKAAVQTAESSTGHQREARASSFSGCEQGPSEYSATRGGSTLVIAAHRNVGEQGICQNVACTEEYSVQTQTRGGVRTQQERRSRSAMHGKSRLERQIARRRAAFGHVVDRLDDEFVRRRIPEREAGWGKHQGTRLGPP